MLSQLNMLTSDAHLWRAEEKFQQASAALQATESEPCTMAFRGQQEEGGYQHCCLDAFGYPQQNGIVDKSGIMRRNRGKHDACRLSTRQHDTISVDNQLHVQHFKCNVQSLLAAQQARLQVRYRTPRIETRSTSLHDYRNRQLHGHNTRTTPICKNWTMHRC